MKYRLVKRAKGWAVQETDGEPVMKRLSASPVWHTLSTHRFHFIAALRLLILRERERK